MQTRRNITLVYLLLLAAAPSRVLPAALPARDDTVNASVNVTQANGSQITVSVPILDSTATANDTGINNITQVQILDSIDNSTADELPPSSGRFLPSDISIKKGGGGAGSRGSGSSSGTGSGSTGSSTTGSGGKGSTSSGGSWSGSYGGYGGTVTSGSNSIGCSSDWWDLLSEAVFSSSRSSSSKGSSSKSSSSKTSPSRTASSATRLSAGGKKVGPDWFYLWYPSTLFESAAGAVVASVFIIQAVTLALATILAASWIF